MTYAKDLLPTLHIMDSQMFSKLRNTLIAIATSITITGCGVSESIRYQHKPSEAFYKDFNIEKPILKPFIDNEILLAVSVRDTNFDEYVIWLAFYTKKPSATIFIKNVNIVGNNIEKEIEINKEYVIDENEERDSKIYDVRTNYLRLIDINENELFKFFDEKSQMEIEVKYVIEGETKKMSFIINRKIEKRMIFPT